LVEYFQSQGNMPPGTTPYALIATSFGITIPVTHLGPAPVVTVEADATTPDPNDAAITVTFQAGNDLGTEFNGATIRLNVAQGRTAQWTGTVPSNYVPKN